MLIKIEDALNERSNNFTLMRLLAALGVLFFHCYPLALGKDAELLYPHLFSYLMGCVGKFSVDMFFVVSGFLVTASYLQRANLLQFVEARVLRLFPGLIVSNLFCILVVGLAVTQDSIMQYFSSPDVFSFFQRNVLLLRAVQLDLPGVFTHNPYPTHVNGSLWTLVVELRMYFWVAVLGACAVLRNAKIFNAFFILILLLYAQADKEQFFIVHETHYVRVALQFLLGSFLYINRQFIPLNMGIWLVLAALAFLTRGDVLFPFARSCCFAYAVILVALHPGFRLPAIDRWGDISYGVYIYAFPLQQWVAYTFPGITPMGMLAVVLPITVLLAIVSWRFIEQPALRLKGKINYRVVSRLILGHSHAE